MPSTGSRRFWLAKAKSVFATHGKVNRVYWLVFDAMACLLALGATAKILPGGPSSDSPSTLLALLFAAVSTMIAGSVSGLYERSVIRSRISLVLCAASFAALVALALLAFDTVVLRREAALVSYVFFGGVFFLLVALLHTFVHYGLQRYKTAVLLIGDDRDLFVLRQRLKNEVEYALTGFINPFDDTDRNSSGRVENVTDICRRMGIHEVVVSNDCLKIPRIIENCGEAGLFGCRILSETWFYEEVFEQVFVDDLAGKESIVQRIPVEGDFEIVLKRLMDLTLAIAALALALPLFPLVWCLVRLTSRGAALYSQTRCGWFGKTFRIYKFRTMCVDAEKNGAQWADEKDSRVTGFGRFLRKTRLDEIPQFFNILVGDMSFVGPRPERPEMIERIEKELPIFRLRHCVRPGLTGLAQLRCGYGATVEDAKRKLQHDLYYIKNRSLFMDLQIILRSVATVMKGSR
ncbi:exopolysaccharide biosynthesis polyprenyl glycosylphosphotransferase [Candidatus Sumerlaeota bacterium]|nr:exopolysaccharide biosynthesis polyprenyl glycosylphosphotransferase [Candidatus Sumerlaeota bacterium]